MSLRSPGEGGPSRPESTVSPTRSFLEPPRRTARGGPSVTAAAAVVAVVASTAFALGAGQATAATQPDGGAPVPQAAAAPASYTFTSPHNPILGDGSYYSADPAPLVVPAGAPGNDTASDQLYVYTGHDEAGPTTNDFIMNEWGAFVTDDALATGSTGEWTHHPSLMRPEQVFSWATPGRAYAGQVVPGADGRYYWYVPVHEAASTAEDKFGIGVAVSDSPTGPWTDHVGAPIISQKVPTANTIHNIDPTILVDGEGASQKVYVYWGSFGNLRMLELGQDMKTPVGSVRTVSGLTGFFEGAWAFERNGTYYMAYAGNNAGATSSCTPANYHACIGYATAASPAGPWTYRGTILDPVSSTTSHPGIVEYDGEWRLVYHTADAVGGNHFRRSVAIDTLRWDDSRSPARIEKVVPTPARTADRTPRANVAQEARVTVSNDPVPTQYWIKALNDEIVRPNPLPPDMWGTWTGNNPAQQWVQYTWATPVRVNGSQIDFWNDQPQGTGVGVAAPAAWRIQYWDATAGAWTDVRNPSAYGTSTNGFQSTTFDAVTTTQLRAVLDAPTNGSTFSGVAVEEWKVLAAQPAAIDGPALTVEIGEAELPGTVAATYPGDPDETLALPVFWDAVDPSSVAQAGTFTVEGSVLGYAAGRVTGTVTVVDPADTEGDETAPEVAFSVSGSAGTNGWYRSDVTVRVTGTDDGGGRVALATRVDDAAWSSTPSVRFVDVAVGGDGRHVVAARATDNAGNVSTESTQTVAIDRTAPVSTGVLDETTRTVTVTATDATSGVARIEYMVGTGAWTEYTGPVAAPDSNKHDVSFRAIDAAGNAGTAQRLTIAADVSGPLTGNVAPIATPSASYTAGWNSLGAINDGLVPSNPSQGQLWGTWSGERPESQWLQYDWARPIVLTGAEIQFWQDSPQGTGNGVAQPASWSLQYWDASGQGSWKDVANPSGYGTSTTALNTVTFDRVTTSRLRAVIHADGDGTSYSAVAVSELRVMADDPGTGPGAPEVAVSVTATPRCVGGTAQLAVRVVNDEPAPVSVQVRTPFGTKSFVGVAPGKSAAQTFSARSAGAGAGVVTVVATGQVDGQDVTSTSEVPYAALACG
ncbi:xylosidase/arabinosidase [Oerskovia enterophila]|uniref:Xylosidase/arabinosidase n=1 Tax=Oerskovia enterophila TaxID=43678 RepID=A0ABX2Y8T2_9CELL|nr:xylosidase/arabinosidase [Oerskovia enterophila]